MPGEETPPPDGGACGSEVVKTTVTMTPHIKAVQGQLKAAKSELIKLQQMLQKATKEHNKQLEAARFLLTTQIAAAYKSSRTQGAVSGAGTKDSAGGAAAAGRAAGTGLDEGSGAAGREGGGGGAGGGSLACSESLAVSAAGWNEAFKPIGYLESCFVRKNGTPRQGGIVPHARAKLTLTCFGDSAPSVDGLTEFSHVWVLFLFHQNGKGTAKPKVAPPKLGGGRTGVFSTRSPHRPNPIGMSLGKLEAVDGTTLVLSGLDIIDGTPILDVKPHIPTFDSPPPNSAHFPAWLLATQDPSLALTVTFMPETLEQLEGLAHELNVFRSVAEAKACIEEVLSQDPRSIYRKQKCAGEPYPLCLDVLHIIAEFGTDVEKTAKVVKIELLDDTAYPKDTGGSSGRRLAAAVTANAKAAGVADGDAATAGAAAGN